MSSPKSPKAALLLGAAWTVGGRWSMKAIGLINTIVMARLLLPADYGVVAMAMLAVGLLQALLDFNAGTALLRKAEVGRDEIDSAWSLGILQGVLTGLLLALASPLLARYFQEPRVLWVLVALAVCMPLASLTNVGMTLAQKTYQFGLIFRHQVACKVISVAPLAAGYLLRDYRALVIGIISGYLAAVVLSFTMHPYRPRWDTSRIPEIWGITKWLMFSGMAQYCLRRGDELVASRVGTTREYGLYNVGADLGQLPTGEIGPALLRALLPVLASLQDDVARANTAVIKTVAALNSITVPVGFGFAALAVPATALVLGPAWAEAVPFIVVFALVNTVQLMSNPLNTLLIMRGHAKRQSHLVWLEFAAFAALALLLVPSFGWAPGLFGLALARLAATALSLLSTAAVARKHCGLSISRLAFAIGRPAVGAALMAMLIRATLPLAASPLGQVAVGVLAGGSFYVVWAFASWQLSGRPEGSESTLLDALNRWRAGRALRGSTP